MYVAIDCVCLFRMKPYPVIWTRRVYKYINCIQISSGLVVFITVAIGMTCGTYTS